MASSSGLGADGEMLDGERAAAVDRLKVALTALYEAGVATHGGPLREPALRQAG